ncbi:hypothetical protein Tco_1303532 [Tanacetum coccineum]
MIAPWIILSPHLHYLPLSHVAIAKLAIHNFFNGYAQKSIAEKHKMIGWLGLAFVDTHKRNTPSELSHKRNTQARKEDLVPRMAPLIVQIWARSGFDGIEEFLSGMAVKLEEIQDEDTSPSKNTSEIPIEVKVEEHSLGDLKEPTNYKAAMLDPESNKWLDAMNVKMKSMKDNNL